MRTFAYYHETKERLVIIDFYSDNSCVVTSSIMPEFSGIHTTWDAALKRLTGEGYALIGEV